MHWIFFAVQCEQISIILKTIDVVVQNGKSLYRQTNEVVHKVNHYVLISNIALLRKVVSF